VCECVCVRVCVCERVCISVNRWSLLDTHTNTYRHTLQPTAIHTSKHCNPLQRNVIHCNTLQRTHISGTHRSPHSAHTHTSKHTHMHPQTNKHTHTHPHSRMHTQIVHTHTQSHTYTHKHTYMHKHAHAHTVERYEWKAISCNTLQRTATKHPPLLPELIALHIRNPVASQHNTNHCNHLQPAATHYNTFQHTHLTLGRIALYIHTPIASQHTTPHCNPLQPTATHRNTHT